MKHFPKNGKNISFLDVKLIAYISQPKNIVHWVFAHLDLSQRKFLIIFQQILNWFLSTGLNENLIIIIILTCSLALTGSDHIIQMVNLNDTYFTHRHPVHSLHHVIQFIQQLDGMMSCVTILRMRCVERRWKPAARRGLTFIYVYIYTCWEWPAWTGKCA